MEENKNIMAIKASKTLATRTSQSGKARVAAYCRVSTDGEEQIIS